MAIRSGAEPARWRRIPERDRIGETGRDGRGDMAAEIERDRAGACAVNSGRVRGR